MWRFTSRLFWRLVDWRVAKNGKVICDVDACDQSGFYSPIVDRRELRDRPETLWPHASACAGMDFNHDGQAELLKGPFSELVGEFDYPHSGADDMALDAYYLDNSEFTGSDARILFGLLRLWRPGRIIEVGSGYSTLLMADVVDRYLPGTRITAIEPYPRPFLHRLTGSSVELVEKKVQEVDASVFAELGPGDVLFIDSSHVSKTGSDVNYLVFEIIPRLKPGVHIHFHDVFLPFEYPKDWVMERGVNWNEQYLLRALLMFSAQTLRVTLGCAYAVTHLQELAAPITQGRYGMGGSIWLTKVG